MTDLHHIDPRPKRRLLWCIGIGIACLGCNDGSPSVIESIHIMCQTWGAQKRYKLSKAPVYVSEPMRGDLSVPPDATPQEALKARQDALQAHALKQIEQFKSRGSAHEQGWSPDSLTAKFKELQDGAGSGSFRLSQFNEESFTGDGLLVHRAMEGSPERLRAILFVHYVPLKVKTATRAHVLSVSVPEYWRDIDRLHYWIAARVPRESDAA